MSSRASKPLHEHPLVLVIVAATLLALTAILTRGNRDLRVDYESDDSKVRVESSAPADTQPR